MSGQNPIFEYTDPDGDHVEIGFVVDNRKNPERLGWFYVSTNSESEASTVHIPRDVMLNLLNIQYQMALDELEDCDGRVPDLQPIELHPS